MIDVDIVMPVMVFVVCVVLRVGVCVVYCVCVVFRIHVVRWSIWYNTLTPNRYRKYNDTSHKIKFSVIDR